MTLDDRRRPAILLALLVTAIASGAFAGLVTAGFIWLIERGTALVWTDLPDAVGVDPFRSWWLFAVPIVGGVLVGVGQMVLGNYPRPLDEAIATWKAGGHIEPSDAPKSAVNSLFALVCGGPVGFEAALTELIGGTATWVGARIGAVGRLVRQAWGADRIDGIPHAVRELPYWLAALSGLFTYHWLPFGAIDVGFRVGHFDGRLGIAAGLTAFAFAALIAVPTAWALSVVGAAERSMLFRRSPILAAVVGGIVFALIALPNELVLFSGQQGIRLLPDAGTGTLVYIAIAKWAALVVALYAGWRGGPIFPTYTSVAAIAVLVDQVVRVGPDIVIVAGIAAASVVFLKGNVPVAVVLTLYPVQLTYASVILVGCVGGALGLAVARSVGALPRGPAAAIGEDRPTAPTGWRSTRTP
jgi:chloride channel protein, CIC family